MKKLIFSLLCFLSINAAEYNSVFEPGQEITIRNESGHNCELYLVGRSVRVKIANLLNNSEKVIELIKIRFNTLFELSNLKISAVRCLSNGDVFWSAHMLIGKKYYILPHPYVPGDSDALGHFSMFDET